VLALNVIETLEDYKKNPGAEAGKG